MSSAPFELVDVVVRAGAGAGKTTELTQRVLTLAENFHAEHGRFPHFVVTTFTRKATQELRERLLHKALEKEDQALLDFVKSPSHLHISTIHGVLSLYLSRFGSALGLSPRLKVVDEKSQRFLLKKTLRDLCAADPAVAEAFQSVLEEAEFDDVLATLLTYFELSLRFEKPPRLQKKEILESIAAEKKNLFNKAHELAEKILQSTEDEKWRNLASVLSSLTAETDLGSFAEHLPSVRKNKSISETLDAEKKEFLENLKDLSSWNRTADFADKHESVSAAFEKVAVVLSDSLFRRKIEKAELSMADLESFSLALIHRHPDTAEHFSRRWDYWLVDEYQDTSPTQVMLLKALIGKRKSFVVGDPQQSIYLFRGARSEVFDERQNEVSRQGGHCVSKMQNYRSRPQLLLFFNDLFTGLSPQFLPMQPTDEAKEEWRQPVEQDVAQIVILPETKDSATRKFLEWQTAVNRCLQLQKMGVPLESICILSRKNEDLEEMALLARKVGLAVQVHAAGRFFERREILDALALLKFLINPHDNKNLITLLRSPFAFLRDQEILDALTDSDNKGPSSHWTKILTLSHPRLEELKNLQAGLSQKGIGQTWFEGLERLGFFDLSERIDPTGRREANLWKLISLVHAQEKRPGFQYLDFLKSQGAGELDLESSREGDAVPVVEPRRVNLMTIHASKGLQFDHVILADMGGRSAISRTEFFNFDEHSGKWTLALPDPQEGSKKTSLFGLKLIEEKRAREEQELDRQLYVALTRAKQTVTLIWTVKPASGSWAARLKINLSAGEQATDNYRYVVHDHLGALAAEPEARSSGQIPAAKWTAPASLGREKMKSLSVTEILDRRSREKMPQALRKKMSIAGVQKAITGVDIHRVFESLQYHAKKDPHFTPESLLPSLSEKEQTALTYLIQDHNGLWLELIRDGFVEWGFAVLQGHSLIQGQIDLWGVDSSGQAWLVDYKTGSPEALEKALEQLQIYAWALAKMNKLQSSQPVKLAVIYPLAGLTEVRTCRIDEIQF
jgi:ATP-dependent helicase/nuclease subunit A